VKNILVTGGAGFIGSAFVRHRVTAHPGLNIIVFDRLTFEARSGHSHGVRATGRQRLDAERTVIAGCGRACLRRTFVDNGDHRACNRTAIGVGYRAFNTGGNLLSCGWSGDSRRRSQADYACCKKIFDFHGSEPLIACGEVVVTRAALATPHCTKETDL